MGPFFVQRAMRASARRLSIQPIRWMQFAEDRVKKMRTYCLPFLGAVA